MRIRIDDDFDSELEKEYKAIDNDLVVGNGILSNENLTIIEVNAMDIRNDKEDIEKDIMDISTDEINNYNLNNGFSIEIQGATLMDSDEGNEKNKSQNRLEEKTNNLKEERKHDRIHSNKNEGLVNDDIIKKRERKERCKTKENSKVKDKECVDIKKVKGKITVYARLGDVKGTCISEAKINLYALNGLSPKLISSKFTDESGIVIFDNLEEGSYRVIEIVNRKYFEKPTYVQWNEVTINKHLEAEEIIVVNKIRRYQK
ncbi:prealbumin-like fold domain-containing protein [Clostridioides difficile]